jgi:hypothetical protein
VPHRMTFFRGEPGQSCRYLGLIFLILAAVH